MSDKYSRILEITYQLIAQHGIEKTSMSLIAKEMGVTKPAIYYYFSSKEKLVRTLFEVLVTEIQFTKFFQIEKYSKENFCDQLIMDGIRMIQEQGADPYYENVMRQYSVLAARENKYQVILEEVLYDFLQGFTTLLQRAHQFGLLPDEEIAIRAQYLTLVVDGLDQYTDERYGFDAEAIWKFTVQNFF
ncbi:TetR/AcrR family transcriptional regulator [Mechercharimyces sp. CAU 1602]|uniref:TetR/AcrR family transcriptional regulator n=1 Tax=Mechercharimyces sp. CAU 1602 TaxID=2973933 RepID=UPI0021624864|nr:TetR/AcrR family transcriptional regulator [Mechercharimyces sp. CAU 1602]MCS1352105.1 TetR/AcrR family transcriptional regulator [Mechercharimyces sp. CAU 1602]